MPRMDLGLYPILTMTMTEPTCDVPRAAEIMNVHENTVYDLIEACEPPAAKLGRGWGMLTQDVLRLVTEAIRAQTAARIIFCQLANMLDFTLHPPAYQPPGRASPWA